VPMSAMSAYSIRWNSDGQGFPLKILKVDLAGQDFGASALTTLMSAEGNDEWVEEARVWTQQARSGLCGILREALHGVGTDSFNEGLISSSAIGVLHNMLQIQIFASSNLCLLCGHFSLAP
jgi:hypothetical protein